MRDAKQTTNHQVRSRFAPRLGLQDGKADARTTIWPPLTSQAVRLSMKQRSAVETARCKTSDGVGGSSSNSPDTPLYMDHPELNMRTRDDPRTMLKTEKVNAANGRVKLVNDALDRTLSEARSEEPLAA